VSPEKAIPILIETAATAVGSYETIELHGTATSAEVLEAMEVVLHHLRQLEENATA